MGQENGEAGYFVNIRILPNKQLQLQTNAPPGHFMMMIESAKASMIQQAVEQETVAAGRIAIPPPGTKFR